MTEGPRTGPYFVSVESPPGMLERLEVERFTNVTIATGRGDDSVGLIDAHVPGTLRIDTGPGDDAVGWEDSGAVKLRIETGGGDDTMVFDGGGFGRRSSITMGAGDDLIIASSGFAGPSTIDGGGGDDVGYPVLDSSRRPAAPADPAFRDADGLSATPGPNLVTRRRLR